MRGSDAIGLGMHVLRMHTCMHSTLVLIARIIMCYRWHCQWLA